MNRCPDHCSGGNHSRQHELNNNQYAQLSDSAKNEISITKGKAYRCSYCGCVYLEEKDGNRKLGDLDGGMTGEGWASLQYP